MNYRSVNDLSRLVSQNACNVPTDVEVVVGIPRSGMLAASIIALKANLPLTDLYSFIRNDELRKGSTRSYKLSQLVKPQDARKILLVDDSIASGNSLQKAVETLKATYTGEVVTLAAFAQSDARKKVDIHFEVVNQPRVFEWNIMHHPYMAEACLDIDGVLCVDPTQEENDDGPIYREFLHRTRPMVIPSVKVKHLVTSRLEKYRAETEEWLSRNGVQYGTLHMLDLPSAEERRRLNMHHKFKASVYRSDPLATLFVESEPHQAIEIMRAANKPVYCTDNNQMYVPGMSIAAMQATLEHKSASLQRKVLNRLRRIASRFNVGRFAKP
jgi:uncharacterized HAD superfamily protein/hypoxanthine phosphoribosyltransferase